MSAPEASIVVEPAGEGRSLARVGEFALTFEWLQSGADARVLDTDLAAWVGYERPRVVRELIRRLIKAGFLNDSEVRRTTRQTSARGGRPTEEFWLTRTGALKVAMRSDTPRAHAMVDLIIRVFEAVLDGRAPAPQAPAPPAAPALDPWRQNEIRVAQAGFLERAIEAVKRVTAMSPESEAAYALTIAETATGKSLVALRPKVDHVDWSTPTDIALRTGTTPIFVGRVITALGVRRHVPGRVEQYTNKADNSDRLVDCWRYCPEVAAEIEAEVLRRRGKKKR